jgi:hypothetical protein
MNDKDKLLLFREMHIHFWEDKIMITGINQHFEQLSWVAQNFEGSVVKIDQYVYAPKFPSNALRKEM